MISYAEYLAEHIDNSIAYSEYIAEHVDNSIAYSEYIAEHVDNSIDYSRYLLDSMRTGIIGVSGPIGSSGAIGVSGPTGSSGAIGMVGPQCFNGTSSTWLGPQGDTQISNLPVLDIEINDKNWLQKNSLEDYFPTLQYHSLNE